MAFFTMVFTMKLKELWQTNVQKFRGLSLYVTFDYTVRDVKKGFFEEFSPTFNNVIFENICDWVSVCKDPNFKSPK